jgi:hypothetical protein
MNAFTIVTVVRALITAGQNDAAIAATLQTMGFDAPANNPAPRQTSAPAAGRGNPQLLPSVAYRMSNGMTAQRVAAMNLPASENQIAALLLTAGPLGRRAITERLNHETKKVTESLVHKMRTRGIIESVAADATAPAMPGNDNPLAALIAAEQTNGDTGNGRRARKTAKRGRKRAAR